MDIKTYELLKYELKNNKYSANRDDVVRLFKKFSTEEVYDVEEILPKYCEFVAALQEMRGLCSYMTNEEFSDFYKSSLNDLVSYPAYWGYMVDKGYAGEDKLVDEYYSQAGYVDRVNSIAGHNRDIKILDVGAGEVPYSSIMLAESFDKVSAMDKFILSDECIRRFGVESRDKLFDSATGLGNYDFIVGNKPCEAIPNIVKACAEQKKPYFMVLCACKSPNHSLAGWQEYLRKYDRDIKFSRDNVMAYNLDM